MTQALISEWGNRYEVVDSELTIVDPEKRTRTNPFRRKPRQADP